MTFPLASQGIIDAEAFAIISKVYDSISSETWFTGDLERREAFARYIITMYQRGMVRPDKLQEICWYAAAKRFSDAGSAISVPPRQGPTPWFIAIGASGPEGLADIRQLLSCLPASLDAVLLLVLHRPWDHPSHLKSVLSRNSELRICIAIDGHRFEPGTVYIGEPSEHLTLAAKNFGKLIDDPERGFRNRTVDLLFNSVAEHGGPRVIGVVLSGGLDDGSRGLAAIAKAGGVTMVMTPSKLPRVGMPENATRFPGRINLIGEAEDIAQGICRVVSGHGGGLL